MALTVTVFPRTLEGFDEMGDAVPIDGEPYDLPVMAVYPTTSNEAEDLNRRQVTTGMTVLAEEGSRVGPHDELSLPGYEGRWSVAGEAYIWDSRSSPVRRRGFRVGGRRPGLNLGCVQINVERVDG